MDNFFAETRINTQGNRKKEKHGNCHSTQCTITMKIKINITNYLVFHMTDGFRQPITVITVC